MLGYFQPSILLTCSFQLQRCLQTSTRLYQNHRQTSYFIESVTQFLTDRTGSWSGGEHACRAFKLRVTSPVYHTALSGCKIFWKINRQPRQPQLKLPLITLTNLGKIKSDLYFLQLCAIQQHGTQ